MMFSPAIIIATRGLIQPEYISTQGRNPDAYVPNHVGQVFTFYSRLRNEIIFTVNIGYYEPHRQPPLGDR